MRHLEMQWNITIAPVLQQKQGSLFLVGLHYGTGSSLSMTPLTGLKCTLFSWQKNKIWSHVSNAQ